jgi:hypothetical protein
MVRIKILRAVCLSAVVLLASFTSVGNGADAKSNSSMKPVAPAKPVKAMPPFSDANGASPVELPEAMKQGQGQRPLQAGPAQGQPGMMPDGIAPMGNAPVKEAAGCLVKVLSNPEVLQINASVLGALLNSPFAKKECKGDIDSMTVRVYPAAEDFQKKQRGNLYHVSIDGATLEGRSSQQLSEILTDLCKYMENALAKEYQRSKDRLEKQLEQALGKKVAAEAEIDSLRAIERALYDKAGCDDLDRDSILRQARSLQDQRRQMKMDLAAMEARREVVGKSVSQTDGSNELAQLAINLAETQAKLGVVNDQLKEIEEKKLLELADLMDRQVRSRLDTTNKACEQAFTESENLRDKVKWLQVPEVTVIGGK